MDMGQGKFDGIGLEVGESSKFNWQNEMKSRFLFFNLYFVNSNSIYKLVQRLLYPLAATINKKTNDSTGSKSWISKHVVTMCN